MAIHIGQYTFRLCHLPVAKERADPVVPFPISFPVPFRVPFPCPPIAPLPAVPLEAGASCYGGQSVASMPMRKFGVEPAAYACPVRSPYALRSMSSASVPIAPQRPSGATPTSDLQ